MYLSNHEIVIIEKIFNSYVKFLYTLKKESYSPHDSQTLEPFRPIFIRKHIGGTGTTEIILYYIVSNQAIALTGKP